jgi:hypothetical protein
VFLGACRAVTMLCSINLTSLPATPAEAAYSVEGNLAVWVSGGTPTEQAQSASFGFSAEVLGDRYKIRLREEGKSTNYFEYVYTDGALYVFHHKRPSEIQAGRISRAMTPTDLAPYYASVSARDIPPGEPCRPQFIWFAYCSASYFQSLSNSMALPIWSPEDPTLYRQPFEMLVYYKVGEAAPHLPASVDFINDGVYRSYNSRQKMLDVIQLSPPYDRGFTNAFYRVLAGTNCGNLVLPASFVFQVYSSPISAGSKPFPRLIVRGTASRVANAAPEAGLPPQFAGVASVTDWRQPGAAVEHGAKAELPYVAYPITNAGWLQATQVASLRARIESKVQKRLAMQRAAVASPPWKIKLVRCLIAVSLLPILYLAWKNIERVYGQKTTK